MNYFLAPRSGEKSHKNFESTIKNGVPLERIAPYLDLSELHTLLLEEVIYAWGNRKGTKAAWEAMEIGDRVLFYANKKIVMAGEVYLKKHSPEMALAMWPADENGNPWEFTFFIKNLQFLSLPIQVFNSMVGYKANYIVQGFIKLNPSRIGAIESQYGSVEKMLYLFSDSASVEAPLPGEKVYVNIDPDVKPKIIHNIRLSPRQRLESKRNQNIRSRKIDHVARIQANSLLGSKGEQIVMDIEKSALVEAGYPLLAERVRRVSVDDDSLGYDVLSFDPDGTEKYIEVKTSSSPNKAIRFFISNNELQISQTKKNYFIYFVEKANTHEPVVTIISQPINDSRFSMTPDGYILEAERGQS